MNFESNESEIAGNFYLEGGCYGTSRLEKVVEELDKMKKQKHFMVESMNLEFIQGEEIDIEWDITFDSVDAQQIVEELETQDNSINFVEENTLMVGY